MKKFYLIAIIICLVTIGIAFADPVFEFKTINPAYEEIPTYDQPDSYTTYKQKRIILTDDNVFSVPWLKNFTNNDKSSSNNQSQLPKAVTNYSVYTPHEYKPVSPQKEAILFVIDFSGSMHDKVSGKRKIDMAVDTMHNILPQLSPNAQLGLRIYGHRAGVTTVDSCLASDLVVPIAKNSAPKIYAELTKFRPRGNTPITYSLKQAVNKDFKGFTAKKRIILLTDGGENCDESPCTYVMNNLAQRDDVSIDVIAFDIDNPEANAQLKCTALVSSGKFYKADTEAQLVNSLTKSLNIEKDVQGVIIKDIK